MSHNNSSSSQSGPAVSCEVFLLAWAMCAITIVWSCLPIFFAHTDQDDLRAMRGSGLPSAASRLSVVSSVLEACNVRQAVAVSGLEAFLQQQRCSSLPIGRRCADAQSADERAVAELQSEIIRHAASSKQPGDMVGSALEGRQLSGVDLSLSHLSGSFNRCNLTHATLSGAVLTKCTFHLALLNDADFVDARFHSCAFVGAELQNVDGRLARFANCTFHRCDMTNWKVGGAVFVGCDMHNCDLSRWEYDGQTTFSGMRQWESARRDGWRQSVASQKQHGVRNYHTVMGPSATAVSS